MLSCSNNNFLEIKLEWFIWFEILDWLCSQFWINFKTWYHTYAYNKLWVKNTDWYLVILEENPIFKKWIFWKWDLILKDKKSPAILWENYKWKNYNFWNLCYINYKPDTNKIKKYDIIDCLKINDYNKENNFDLSIKLDSKKCFIKYKFPEKNSKLQKCELWENPWFFYENCCPEDEYYLLIFLREKYVSWEIKTIQDLKNFIKQESEIYEKTKTETQTPKTEINFQNPIFQTWFFESIIFSTILLFAYLFKN